MTTDKLRKNRRMGYFALRRRRHGRRAERRSGHDDAPGGPALRPVRGLDHPLRVPRPARPPAQACPRDVTEAVSAGWVIPVDGPPIENGYVAWEDGRIVEVGQGRVDRHYGEDALILPGIVNAHSHLEYSVYAGFGDGQPFGSWLATHIAPQAGARPATTWSRSPATAPPSRSPPASRRRPTTASRAPPPTPQPHWGCGRSSTSRSSGATRTQPRRASRSCGRGSRRRSS